MEAASRVIVVFREWGTLQAREVKEPWAPWLLPHVYFEGPLTILWGNYFLKLDYILPCQLAQTGPKRPQSGCTLSKWETCHWLQQWRHDDGITRALRTTEALPSFFWNTWGPRSYVTQGSGRATGRMMSIKVTDDSGLDLFWSKKINPCVLSCPWVISSNSFLL